MLALKVSMDLVISLSIVLAISQFVFFLFFFLCSHTCSYIICDVFESTFEYQMAPNGPTDFVFFNFIQYNYDSELTIMQPHQCQCSVCICMWCISKKHCCAYSVQAFFLILPVLALYIIVLYIFVYKYNFIYL